jgi:hypothetical protein
MTLPDTLGIEVLTLIKPVSVQTHCREIFVGDGVKVTVCVYTWVIAAGPRCGKSILSMYFSSRKVPGNTAIASAAMAIVTEFMPKPLLI